MARPSELTDAELDEAIALIAEHGTPIAHIANYFGQRKQAFYNRARRHPDWDAKVLKAKFEHLIKTFKAFDDAIESKTAWQALAWKLERLHGITDPVTKAKLEELKKDRGQRQEAAAKMREMFELARDQSEGTPSEAAEGDE